MEGFLSYEELDLVLQKVVAINPNNQEIKLANEMIKSYTKHVQSVEGLLLHCKNNQNYQIRQLAAIILNRRLEKHWNKMDATIQVTLKNLIVELYLSEKNYLVQKSIALLILRIAKINLINGEWNDLHQFIFTDPTKYSTEQANLFELNLYIISELIENCSFYLKNRLNEIRVILELSLNLGSMKMKENATKCLGNLVRSLENNELSAFKTLIPCIFKEIKNFTEETILHIYETLCDFHINSLSFFEDFFDVIVPLTVEFIQNDEFSSNTKLVLSEFLLMLAECKKKIFTKNNCQFLKLSVEVAYKLASIEEDEEDKNDFNNECSSYSIGMRLIDSLSQIISSKFIFPLCSDYIKKLLQSSNPFERKAAISSIGAIAEGCNEKVREILEDIVNILVNAFVNDTSIVVRSSAIVAMDYLTQYCSPEITDFHEKIIPMLILGLNSNEEEILEKSLIEINYFCRNLDVELEPYINEMLPKLIFLLENHKSVKVQEECLFALSSIIGSAQNLIHKTLFPILETCKTIILNRKSEKENELRANSLECVSQIAYVIKLEQFRPYMDIFTNFALECVKSSVYEFQDAGMMYFGSVAQIMGEQFADSIPVLMECAFTILKDESGISSAKDKDELGLDSDSEVDDDKEEGKISDVYVDEAFVDAKCSAILAVTNFAKASPKNFINYIKDVFTIFDTLWDYVHDNINVELIQAYETLLEAIYEAENITDDVNKANSLALKVWTADIFPKYEKIIDDSDVKEEVSKVLEAIYNIINYFGKELFLNNNTLQRLITIAQTLLEFKAACQLKNEEDDEEDIDHDEQILGGVVDLFLIISEKIENEFHPFFAESFASLKKYLSVQRSESDRSMVFGCIADVFKHCKMSVKFYIDIVFNIIDENMKKNAKKKHDDLYRHIAYLLGVLFESDPVTARNYFTVALGYLQTIFENSNKNGKDNVIAALSRISIALNLTFNDELFPKIVETIFSNCPLTHDTLENPSLFKFVAYLLDKMNIDHFNLYGHQILNLIKMIVLNEIKCGTSKPLLKEVRNYLETINNNPILKDYVDKFVANMSDLERDRFVQTIRNS